ncbi:MAG: DUF6484 domain-containing protein [Myxococcota bacterium]
MNNKSTALSSRRVSVTRDSTPSPRHQTYYHTLLGTVVELEEDRDPEVEFETANGEILRHKAVSTVPLGLDAVGHPVVLMFLRGEVDHPVIIGRVEMGRAMPNKTTRTQNLVIEGRKLALHADSSLTLRCGRSSITLTREGRIVLRGTNLVSEASGTHRIRGGTIKLN